MAAITSAILAGAGLAATGVGMAQQQSAAKYNEDLAEIEGEVQQRAIEDEASRLADNQKELKASQRVAIAAGGGGSQQTQSLMLLADQANKMQLDQIELKRTGDVAGSRAKSRSLLAQMQGKEALLSGIGSLAKQGYSAYGAYQSTRSTTGED